MKCQKCNSKRVLSICAKCSDMCGMSTDKRESMGYVMYDIGIGGGDYIEFDYCLECGQIQYDFPVYGIPEDPIMQDLSGE